MEELELWISAGTWTAFFGYWWLVGRKQSSNERTEERASRLLRTSLMLVAFWLIVAQPEIFPDAATSMLPDGIYRFLLEMALTLSGMGLSIWARVHLGRNWSQAVTLKKDHQLIQSGPYRWLRHPIYTGLLLAIAGCVAKEANLTAVLAWMLVAVALVKKLCLEEKWLAGEFNQNWQEYVKKSYRLLPFLY